MHFNHYQAAIIITALLVGCSGSGGSNEQASQSPGSSGPSSFDLLDPSPGPQDNFGSKTHVLPNGNIIVLDQKDSRFAQKNGAVHLYSPTQKKLVSSIYGDQANDEMGSSGIEILNNGHFLIVTEFDDVSGVSDAGSVTLVDGNTGQVIGTPMSGDNDNDFFGGSGITLLENSNYVVTSAFDQVGGNLNAGSVYLIDGNIGALIGSPTSGDNPNDAFGISGITPLTNGNYVIASETDGVGGNANAGSVTLIDGTNGITVGVPITGDQAVDSIGNSGITSLQNGNYVVVSDVDNVGALDDVGTVTLVNGLTGAIIGTPLSGDNSNDFLGRSGVSELPNGNYVVSSAFDVVNGNGNAGSVMLVDGGSGNILGLPLAGDNANDQFGKQGVIPLSNSNYVVISSFDTVGGNSHAGSVTLVNGTTGAVIGTPFTGNVTNDEIGNNGVFPLGNNNYVIVSSSATISGNANAGSVALLNGNTGSILGSPLTGDNTDDQVGGGGITVLQNGNYIVASPSDSVGANNNTGSVTLVDGTTGAIIGSPFTGNDPNDSIGSGGITLLANNNFVVASPSDNVGGNSLAGSVALIDSDSGSLIGTLITGDNSGDSIASAGITPLINGNFVIASELDNVNGLPNAGAVMLIDGGTGTVIGTPTTGDNVNDFIGKTSITAFENGNFVIASHLDDVNGVINAGSVLLLDGNTGATIGDPVHGQNSGDFLGISGITSLEGNSYLIASEYANNGAGTVKYIYNP